MLALEPVPVMDYSTIAESDVQKVGEGILLYSRDPKLNSTKLLMYAVTESDRGVHDLNTLLKGYKPVFRVYVGGSTTWNLDILVFIIVNTSYIRAWQIAPVEHPSTTAPSATETEKHIAIQLPPLRQLQAIHCREKPYRNNIATDTNSTKLHTRKPQLQESYMQQL